MAHLRSRHILTELKKLSGFWPIVGVLGLRQCGKSTLFRDLVGIENFYTLDDEDTLEDVELSAKNFLAKVGHPLVIDEAQKSVKLFDALKLFVDKKRRPGSYFLTGSSQFSAKVGIQESLTGRIGLIHLFPFTLSEAFQEEFTPGRIKPIHSLKTRFTMLQAFERLTTGGLPTPLFTRDKENRKRYFRNWLETAILRDAARVYGKGYDPDIAWSILRQMGSALREGEGPTLSHFKQSSRTLRKYLHALESIFLLRKIPCHEAGVGKEIWMPTDGGLACEIMESDVGEGVTLSLGRIFVFNEILARLEYSGSPLRPLYYKSARGSPVDLIWGDTVIKISHLSKSQVNYDERSVHGALRKLRIKKGIIAVPRDEISISTREPINVVPWTFWS